MTRRGRASEGRRPSPAGPALFFRAVLAAGVLGAGAEHLTAQEVTRAVLSADLEPHAASRVRVTYEVTLDPTLDSVPILAARLLGAEIRGVVATTDGERLAVRFGRRESGALAGMIAVPPDQSDSTFTFDLLYEVEQRAGADPDRFDRTLPIVMVDWTPADSRPELFSAHLAVPDGYAVLETFPLVSLRSGTPGASGEIEYSLTLPVVPSMLRIRGRSGDRPLLTFGGAIDLAVGLILLVLAGFGWAALQEQTRRTEREARERSER